MRSYSRARSLADQLAANHRTDPGGLAPAPDGRNAVESMDRRNSVESMDRRNAVENMDRRSAVESNVSSGFERLRQHLEQVQFNRVRRELELDDGAVRESAAIATPPTGRWTRPAATGDDHQNDAQDPELPFGAYDGDKDDAADDDVDEPLDVPRFVADAASSDADADDDLYADEERDARASLVSYDRPLRVRRDLPSGHGWSTIRAFSALLVPGMAGLAILAYAGGDQPPDASLLPDRQLIMTLSGGLFEPWLGSETRSTLAAADGNGSALDVDKLQALLEPASGTETIAQNDARLASGLDLSELSLLSAAPGDSVVAPIAAPLAKPASGLQMAIAAMPRSVKQQWAAKPAMRGAVGSAPDDDPIPAMTAAMHGAIAVATLDEVSIAWADPLGRTPLAHSVPSMAIPSMVGPSTIKLAALQTNGDEPVGNLAEASASIGAPMLPPPLALGGSKLPVAAASASDEPMISQVVGSVRNTFARQDKVRLRPRPLKKTSAGYAAVTSTGKSVNSAGVKGSAKPTLVIKPLAGAKLAVPPRAAVIAVKRRKPRPAPASANAFLAKQAVVKSAQPSPAVAPVAAKPQKLGPTAWQTDFLLR